MSKKAASAEAETPKPVKSPQAQKAINRLIAATSILSSINLAFLSHFKVPQTMRLPKIIRDAEGTILYELEYEWVTWLPEMEIDKDAEKLLEAEFSDPLDYDEEEMESLNEQIFSNQEEAEENLQKEDFRSCEKGEKYLERLADATLRFVEHVIENFRNDEVLESALIKAVVTHETAQYRFHEA